jgi:hypothetical protein
MEMIEITNCQYKLNVLILDAQSDITHKDIAKHRIFYKKTIQRAKVRLL